MEQQEIYVKSTMDGTMQPSLFFKSDSVEKRPLLVGLHTWSFDRFNQISNMLPVCEQHDFNLLLPEFRGSNLESNPNCRQACGSELAKQDIKDAIDYLIDSDLVDKDNIFLLGLSGGGHMALLMAGMCPEYFKAIGAYVPITDLTKWAKENPKYSPHVLACCDSEEEMLKRVRECMKEGTVHD
jgi:poly(3-hydroxybutyrate) depolymerase